MGIGHQTLMTFEEIVPKGYLKNCKSVMEMGSQIIDDHYQKRARKFLKIKEEKHLSTKDFYLKMGFNEYYAIDADGVNEAFVFDLNYNIKEKYNFDKQYDFVTNFGTSEHVFNQQTFFENTHNLTKKNGLMFHILPFEGQFNHCYFNYHPIFFYDLAMFNNYEILGFWYYSCRSAKKFAPYAGYNYSKPFKYTDDLLKFFDELAKKNKISCSPLDNASHLGILYKKKSDKIFQNPFQSIFLEEDNKEEKRIKSKLEEYSKFEDHLSKKDHLTLNANVNHQDQIEELLGYRIWNFKLGKIFDKKYIKKIIRVLFKKERDPYT